MTWGWENKLLKIFSRDEQVGAILGLGIPAHQLGKTYRMWRFVTGCSFGNASRRCIAEQSALRANKWVTMWDPDYVITASALICGFFPPTSVGPHEGEPILMKIESKCEHDTPSGCTDVHLCKQSTDCTLISMSILKNYKANYLKQIFTTKTKDIQTSRRTGAFCGCSGHNSVIRMSHNLCSRQREKHNNYGTIDTFTLLSPFPAKFIGGARGNNTNGEKGNRAPAI